MKVGRGNTAFFFFAIETILLLKGDELNGL